MTEKRVEVDKHLGDMRDWYKQKFREVAETRWSKYRNENPGTGDSGILKLPARDLETVAVPESAGVIAEAILSMPSDLDPADRKLGELLRSLDIIDRESLNVLWEDAKRQRRTLRHVLLSGGYLTLYQLALIESGNLNALMLGRFRVIDRLLSTQRESVYRVYDPRHQFGGNENVVPSFGSFGSTGSVFVVSFPSAGSFALMTIFFSSRKFFTSETRW